MFIRSACRLTLRAALVLGTALTWGCATTGRNPATRIGTATLVSANGLSVGTAQIFAVGDRVTLTVAASGLPAGVHGIHLHTIGRCDLPTFVTAGVHLNPAARQHGTLNPRGSHLGDLPNLTIARSGVGTFTAMLPADAAELDRSLFDTDGSAIVIHAGRDDYRTDPSGNSGARIACGVLTRN